MTNNENTEYDEFEKPDPRTDPTVGMINEINPLYKDIKKTFEYREHLGYNGASELLDKSTE